MFLRLGLGGLIRAVLARPSLWLEAVRSLLAVRRRSRPWPSAAYLRWRSHTAYGDVASIPARDFVEFLEWRRRMRGAR